MTSIFHVKPAEYRRLEYHACLETRYKSSFTNDRIFAINERLLNETTLETNYHLIDWLMYAVIGECVHLPILSHSVQTQIAVDLLLFKSDSQHHPWFDRVMPLIGTDGAIDYTKFNITTATEKMIDNFVELWYRADMLSHDILPNCLMADGYRDSEAYVSVKKRIEQERSLQNRQYVLEI